MKPWNEYALKLPKKGDLGSGRSLASVMHVTHTASALRILEDGRVVRGLIQDESALNAFRTTVTWLSPNHWHYGSRYGNVEFSFDFAKLVTGRAIYWVERIQKYRPHACRLLISDGDVSKLPVIHYDPNKAKGPLRFIDGAWWWNGDITLELMLDADLMLADCIKLDFINHHPSMCAVDWNSCQEKGQAGDRPAARIVAGILAREWNVVDHLLVNSAGNDVSNAMDVGLSRIPLMLAAINDKLAGPLKGKASIDAALRAALLQLASGDREGAKATAALLPNDRALLKSLSRICEAHLGVKSLLLSSDIDA
jgi:hypothetical protein